MQEAYEYIRTVGEGAYGTVWQCTERATGRSVAVKAFKEAHEDQGVLRMAVREARLLNALRHPNIVSLRSAFKGRTGRVYMVFEYEGPSLHDQLVLQAAGLGSRATKLLAWQLVNALSYLHDRKILHRDVKPANVLLCPSGLAKLCDFGFARSVSCGPGGAQRCTSYCVTRWYRAPEVLVGDEYGAASDIWSLGCTLAEAATGRPLFTGISSADQLLRTLSCLGPLTPAQRTAAGARPGLAPFTHGACTPGRTLRQRLPHTVRVRLMGSGPLSEAWEDGGTPVGAPATADAQPGFAQPHVRPTKRQERGGASRSRLLRYVAEVSAVGASGRAPGAATDPTDRVIDNESQPSPVALSDEGQAAAAGQQLSRRCGVAGGGSGARKPRCDAPAPSAAASVQGLASKREAGPASGSSSGVAAQVTLRPPDKFTALATRVRGSVPAADAGSCPARRRLKLSSDASGVEDCGASALSSSGACGPATQRSSASHQLAAEPASQQLGTSFDTATSSTALDAQAGGAQTPSSERGLAPKVADVYMQLNNASEALSRGGSFSVPDGAGVAAPKGGKVKGGAYEYIGTVGEGAYGVVWKCTERATGRSVAVKCLKQAHEDRAVSRTAVRETRLLKALRHPNIVQLLAAFKGGSGRIYMVMEYVGPSLHNQLEVGATGLPPNAVKLLAWQLVSALSYLHGKKVLHRDVKPANVLLCPSGLAKLCDFGFARSVSCGPAGAERCTSYCVTRWYRAPEVLAGDEYGAASDIWSLACTLAEAATGRPLFTGTSTLDQLLLITSCLGPLTPSQSAAAAARPRLAAAATHAVCWHPPNVALLRQHLSSLGPRLCELLQACLQVDPARRPTAHELLQMPYFWNAHHVAACVPRRVDELVATAAAEAEEGRQRRDAGWRNVPVPAASPTLEASQSSQAPLQRASAEDYSSPCRRRTATAALGSEAAAAAPARPEPNCCAVVSLRQRRPHARPVLPFDSATSQPSPPEPVRRPGCAVTPGIPLGGCPHHSKGPSAAASAGCPLEGNGPAPDGTKAPTSPCACPEPRGPSPGQASGNNTSAPTAPGLASSNAWGLGPGHASAPGERKAWGQQRRPVPAAPAGGARLAAASLLLGLEPRVVRVGLMASGTLSEAWDAGGTPVGAPATAVLEPEVMAPPHACWPEAGQDGIESPEPGEPSSDNQRFTKWASVNPRAPGSSRNRLLRCVAEQQGAFGGLARGPTGCSLAPSSRGRAGMEHGGLAGGCAMGMGSAESAQQVVALSRAVSTVDGWPAAPALPGVADGAGGGAGPPVPALPAAAAIQRTERPKLATAASPDPDSGVAAQVTLCLIPGFEPGRGEPYRSSAAGAVTSAAGPQHRLRFDVAAAGGSCSAAAGSVLPAHTMDSDEAPGGLASQQRPTRLDSALSSNTLRDENAMPPPSQERERAAPAAGAHPHVGVEMRKAGRPVQHQPGDAALRSDEGNGGLLRTLVRMCACGVGTAALASP
ncbi:hypothetical protein HYH03_015882 [Edaphochlamys debaryana]|uniref:cyclin-dependent kinase n=1 Tax=Edaphochlamys debaryana TaxID=47281 RepID=A0A836BQG9_9CHLO|nr:hypothetical protein HYH03_015882 [Edaphochlamys debaryana]|eukprot:KAG2485396.1 hypothetical protein HYH03_015882 [Edaphochlamys debaryana]